MITFSTLHLDRASANAVKSGHPWVYQSDSLHVREGAFVQLVDERSRPLGWGLCDGGAIAVRVLGGRVADVSNWEQVLGERILRADRMRRRLLPSETDTYRVVNGAGDGLPGFVLDRYGELAVLRVYAKAWEHHLDWLVAACRKLGWVSTIYRRLGVRNVDGREGGETLFGEAPADRMVVSERGMRMLVRPYVGQKTGLFLDQREHRALVGQLSAGRRVCNLFSYTGGFSLAAALGGASFVTTVDVAPEAIADAKENFRLNGLDPDHHRFEVADIFAWELGETTDLLVIDPPSLARGKGAKNAAKRCYKQLHQRHAPWVTRDGLLATSSCTAQLSFDEWRQAVKEGLDPWGWSWLSESRAPPDHPVALGHNEGHYLKFSLLRRLAKRG